MDKKIGAVVSYCTNEYRFLSACLQELSKVCDEIVVAVADHFFDGRAENRELLHRSYAEHKDIQFVEYKCDIYGIYVAPFEGRERLHRLHGASRYVGYYMLSEKVNTVLFVDVDEIIEGERVLARLQHGVKEVSHFSSYIYVKDEKTRATEHQNTILLVHKEALQPELLLNRYERPGYFWNYPGEKERSLLGLDGKPMVHHYNWVRSKSELLQKVATWGHHGERDWETLLLEERYHELTPFSYQEVEPTHSLLSIDVDLLSSMHRYRHLPRESFPHVTYVTPQDIQRKSIAALLYSS